MHIIISLTTLLLMAITPVSASAPEAHAPETIASASAPEATAARHHNQQKPMYYYCEYCGQKFTDVRQLTAISCARHPNGANKGKHKLYEGTQKSRYTCKYCGQQFASIQQMTGISCSRHPNGCNKGKHSPAL